MMKSRLRPCVALSLPLAASLALSACVPAMVPNAGPQLAAEAPVAPAKAQAPAVLPAGTFAGMVATWDGQDFVPVAGATIRVEGTSHATTTDAEGRYRFDGLKPGAYKVVASRDGLAASAGRMVLGPVSGTPRVNLAMRPAKYTVQQIAAFTATVTGVVTDPRGSALPGATVKLLCNVSNNGAGSNATETANVNGFYSHELPDVSVNTSSPGQVQATAWGMSPGQVRLETTAVTASNLTTTALVLNVQTDAYPKPGTPTFPNGTYSGPGTIATLNATDLSQRADEFHVRLTSGGLDYDVLPDTVATSGDVTFRIPYTMPASTFVATLMPFGLNDATRVSDASGSFVTQYAQGDLDGDLTYSVGAALADNTVNTEINAGTFLPTDTGRFTLTLGNSNADVAQDIRLSGRVPVGTTIAAATADGVAATITQPDGAGDWSITGFTVGTSDTSPIVIDFVSPLALAKGASFGVTNLAVAMPSANLTKTAAPGAPGALTVDGVDNAAFTVAKAINQSGGADDGVGEVELVLTPTSATALGALRITDRTGTDQSAAAAKATITGTTPLAAAGTGIGLVTGDKLVVSVDGGAPVTVEVFSNSYDLETLIGQINNAAGLKTFVTSRRTAGNNFEIERDVQSSTATIEIDGTNTTANMLAVLGIAPGDVNTPIAGSDGILADFTGASATQTNGTIWTIGAPTTNIQNADGSVSVAFTITPPAAYEVGDDATTPITITYKIVKSNGQTMSLGGSAAGGAAVTNVNLFPPYTNTALDKAVNANDGDPTQVNNL